MITWKCVKRIKHDIHTQGNRINIPWHIRRWIPAPFDEWTIYDAINGNTIWDKTSLAHIFKVLLYLDLITEDGCATHLGKQVLEKLYYQDKKELG